MCIELCITDDGHCHEVINLQRFGQRLIKCCDKMYKLTLMFRNRIQIVNVINSKGTKIPILQTESYFKIAGGKEFMMYKSVVFKRR